MKRAGERVENQRLRAVPGYFHAPWCAQGAHDFLPVRTKTHFAASNGLPSYRALLPLFKLMRRLLRPALKQDLVCQTDKVLLVLVLQPAGPVRELGPLL